MHLENTVSNSGAVLFWLSTVRGKVHLISIAENRAFERRSKYSRIVRRCVIFPDILRHQAALEGMQLDLIFSPPIFIACIVLQHPPRDCSPDYSGRRIVAPRLGCSTARQV